MDAHAALESGDLLGRFAQVCRQSIDVCLAQANPCGIWRAALPLFLHRPATPSLLWRRAGPCEGDRPQGEERQAEPAAHADCRRARMPPGAGDATGQAAKAVECPHRREGEPVDDGEGQDMEEISAALRLQAHRPPPSSLEEDWRAFAGGKIDGNTDTGRK